MVAVPHASLQPDQIHQEEAVYHLGPVAIPEKGFRQMVPSAIHALNTRELKTTISIAQRMSVELINI